MEQENRSTEIPKNFLDIRRIFREKSPQVYRFIPGFIFSYLERVIHQDKLNAAIYRNRNRFGVDFADAILEEFGVNIHVKGLDNIPGDQRLLIASNHPLGGLDGMALMSVIGSKRDIIFPVNDLLMNLPNLKELFIPINKHGSNAENIRIFNETFASDKTILYFPAGLVSRKQNGKIKDIPWQKTFLTKAKKSRRDIVPVHIGGRNSNFFYNLANLRKKSGLKANIEMLYLVDEMYKQNDKDILISISQPVSYEFFDRKIMKDSEWANVLRDYVYALGTGEELDFVRWYERKYK